jgi:hypothetical protein
MNDSNNDSSEIFAKVANPNMINFITKTSSGNHTHTITSHTHYNPDHVHDLSLNVPPHIHPMVIGVQPIDSYCTNIVVEVNNQIVATGINNDSEIDITQYIQLNKTNIVKIHSSSHGFLYVHVYEKRFVAY